MAGSDTLHSFVEVARCVVREAFTDRVMMVAAGLAFFGLFGLLPALAAVGVLYRFLVDEEAIQRQLEALAGFLPSGMTEIASEFLVSIPAGFGLGIGLLLNLGIVLWTVQRSASGLITALNVIYDEQETRNLFRREAAALTIAAGGLVFLVASLFLIVMVPLLAPRLGSPLANVLALARWPALALLFMLTLALLYSFAPSRRIVNWRWIASGAAVATLLWLAASGLFSIYVERAGTFDRYYGSVTATVVFSTWLFISAFVIMLGAEVDAQIAAHYAGRRMRLKEEWNKRERGPDE